MERHQRKAANMDIVEKLRNTPCNREPFTPSHADCQCRVANEAADEIERLTPKQGGEHCLGFHEVWCRLCEGFVGYADSGLAKPAIYHGPCLERKLEAERVAAAQST